MEGFCSSDPIFADSGAIIPETGGDFAGISTGDLNWGLTCGEDDHEKPKPHCDCAALAGALFWNGADKAQSAPAAPETQENTGGMADIVVTAQKRSEKSANVPISIAAFSSASLETPALTIPNHRGVARWRARSFARVACQLQRPRRVWPRKERGRSNDSRSPASSLGLKNAVFLG